MSGIKKDLVLNILMGVLVFGIILVSISRFMPEKEKHENFWIFGKNQMYDRLY